MMTFLLVFLIDWNQVFLRDPIPGASRRDTKPAPTTACFCKDCDPCTCRDGKHSARCSQNAKPPKVIDADPPIRRLDPPEQPKSYQMRGGSGTTWQHTDYQFLQSWIQANDPVAVGSACQPGMPCYRAK